MQENKSNNIIEAKDIYKCYWVGTMPYPALNGINLHIKPGEFTVLAGRSGSGKSTLLNLIGALESADRGQILIDGKNI
ncbi:peptide ABC transporter ATPase, partial [Candidatus Endoriftia persephone str. Guaymas]|nr:peptide ABC transporter ATPase [Candidatus Endoriftia persephone str. Guaymas]